MNRVLIPRDIGLLLARVAFAAIFLAAGYGKIVGYSGSVAYMTKLGVPAASIVAPLVLVFEIAVGIALLVGFKTRIAALAVALFCIATAVLAHWNFGDQNQLNHFLKNIAIAGGALALHLSGPGRYSVDEGSSAGNAGSAHPLH